MIIVRSPLRISLGGGGTDLASYYRDHEGFLIAAAIDKYVYVSVIRPFRSGIYLKYSEIEHVEGIDQVRHRIIREALKLFPGEASQIEITTLADIPAGTGLGSSGSFTTALLRALHAQSRNIIHPRWSVDDDAVHPAGNGRGFAVQGLPWQSEDSKEPGATGLLTPLRPVQGGALGVGIDQDDRSSQTGVFTGEVGGQRGFTDAAFLIE